MSLINDALKRARVEALRQEAERDGLDYRAVPAHSRRAQTRVIHFIGWAVAGLAIGLAIWFGVRAPEPRTPGSVPASDTDELAPGAARREAQAAATRATSPPVPSPSAPGESRTESVPADEVSSEIEPEAAVGGAEVPPAPADVEPARTPAPERQRSEPSGSTGTIEQRPDNRLEEGATYRRRVFAADGSRLSLGGIAYSEDRPIAVINGSVVAPGDMIAGFTIVAIEPERVELEADGVRFYLSLR